MHTNLPLPHSRFHTAQNLEKFINICNNSDSKPAKNQEKANALTFLVQVINSVSATYYYYNYYYDYIFIII